MNHNKQNKAKLRLCKQIIIHIACMQNLRKMEAYPICEMTNRSRVMIGCENLNILSKEASQNQNHHREEEEREEKEEKLQSCKKLKFKF